MPATCFDASAIHQTDFSPRAHGLSAQSTIGAISDDDYSTAVTYYRA